MYGAVGHVKVMRPPIDPIITQQKESKITTDENIRRNRQRPQSAYILDSKTKEMIDKLEVNINKQKIRPYSAEISYYTDKINV